MNRETVLAAREHVLRLEQDLTAARDALADACYEARADVSASELARLAGVSRQGLYKWLHRPTAVASGVPSVVECATLAHEERVHWYGAWLRYAAEVGEDESLRRSGGADDQRRLLDHGKLPPRSTMTAAARWFWHGDTDVPSTLEIACARPDCLPTAASVRARLTDEAQREADGYRRGLRPVLVDEVWAS